MKKLLLALSLSSCVGQDVPPIQKQTVRLTVYWKAEDGWTRRGFTSTGEPLVSYETVAVDPKVFPYGSVIEIPELGLKTVARDCGSAVISRKASRKMGRNDPVIDLYIEDKEEAISFANTSPYFVQVEVSAISSNSRKK